MRILHLTAGNLYGGIETYLVTLARCRQLVPSMEPHFAVCFAGRVYDELAATGVPTYELGPVRLSRPWTTWRARRQLRTRLTASCFDAVVMHGCWSHAVFASTVRRLGIPVVTAVHDYLLRPSWIDRQAARTPPDLVIANSHFTATAAAKLFSTAAVEVVYLPVATSAQVERSSARHDIRQALGTRPDAVVILQSSRLEEWKGQAILIAALGRMKELPGWEAWIAGGVQKSGESDYLSALRRRVEELGISERVRFLGQRSDVRQLMAAADVYCQPNTGPEPFGLAFVEALQAGLPVVTSGFGGAAEIVDATCGILTRPADIAAVSTALVELIDNPVRRAELGLKGPGRAAELCDPPRQLERLAHALQGVSAFTGHGRQEALV